MSDRDEESIGKMRTWGHEESARSPQESAWDPGMSIGGLTTRRPEGIDDDGRTDGARRWKAGEEILGRYVVERELGQGGMGVVYGCFDKTGGVKVAVKCLPPELGHNSVEMEEVRENFELVVGLRHPNIAGVRTLERDGRGEYYLVMDEAEGENLRAWLRRKWKAGGVSPEEAVGVLRQVASALDYAHGEKVVHRDVKPGNVMIDGQGRVKVLDFGLAAQIRTSMSRASHVYRGTSGTGPYMAPEQWRGRRQDGKTDQYALGVMAYEMLAGHLPFENDEVSVLREVVLKEEPEDIPGVPKGAMASIRRAMAKSAEDRFPACGAFVDALESGGRKGGASTPCEPEKGAAAGTTAGTTARSESSPHQRRKGRSVGGWVAALVLAAAIGAGVWGWREHGVGGGWVEWLAGKENAVVKTARPEGSPHQGKALSEAETRAEEERLAAEKAAEEKRLAEQKAAEEEAKRQEAARERELEEAVYRLAAEAKSKTEATAEYDRGQGFGERLDEAKSKLQQGEAAIQGRNFEKAKEWLEESLAAAKWLEENAPLREEAIRAGRVAEAAKKKADAMDGERLNLPSYQRGNERKTEGARAFENARFKDATAAWNEAGKAYAMAETEARGEKVRQGLEAARGAKWRDAWEEVVAAADGVLMLDTGNTEATQLKEEAETQMKPSILLTATLNGREVAATVFTEDLAHSGLKTPVTINLESGGSYSFAAVYEEGGKEFSGQEMVQVKDRGVTPAAVVLKEYVVDSRAGKQMTVRVGRQKVAFRWCPAGTFTMGSPSGEEGGYGDFLEKQRRVTLSRGFWMGETEVTQGLWREVMGDNPSYFKDGDNYPVDGVSWEDCQKFVQALNFRYPQDGLRWSLPTEAQWEYACRAGTRRALPNGKDIHILGKFNAPALDDIAWYGGNSSEKYSGSNGWDTSGWRDKQYPGGKAGTHPVRGKKANAWGLYDMIGNVQEWCADWFIGLYSSGIETDPTGPKESKGGPVKRGGAWCSWAKSCRSASRVMYSMDLHLNSQGLRIALLPVQ